MRAYDKTRIALLVAGLFAGHAAHVAHAQQAEQQLPEVKVRAEAQKETADGPVQGYRAERSATATKTDTPLHETPQSITVVTRERMEDQGAISIQDALNYAAGVRSDQYGLDTRSDGYTVRGGYPTEYRDGLRRQGAGFYTSTQRVEPYSLERLEVLRGPAAMLYGMGTTAGVVNMVSKRPLAESQREIGLQLGSYGRLQWQADLTGPLTTDGQWLYRLVALQRDAHTQVDYVPDHATMIAPSLTWRPGNATSLTLQALVQQNKSGSSSQFFPWAGTILDGPRGRIPSHHFIGEPSSDRYDTERNELGWLFEHKLNPAWTFRQNTRWAQNKVEYVSYYADFFTNPGGFFDPANALLDRFAYADRRKVDGLTTDQMLEGRFATGMVRHHLLFGYETVRHKESSQSAFDLPISMGGGVPPVNPYDPSLTYGLHRMPALAANPDSMLQTRGLYLQDQMRAGRWIVVAGLRRDTAVNSLAGATDERDSATTVRAGLMHQFDMGLAPYVSYSESFTPIAGLDFFNQRFKPLRGEQVEFGLKYQPPGKRWSANASVFNLKEKNRQVPDPANPLNTLQTGATRNTGLELELVGRVLPWLDLSAHYNHVNVDRALEQIPRDQAAVWGTARLGAFGMAGWRAGLGVRHSASFQDGAGAPTLPANTLVDAMLGFDSGPWRYTLNVQNVADKEYFSTCLNRGDCWFGARRNVVLSAKYKF